MIVVQTLTREAAVAHGDAILGIDRAARLELGDDYGGAWTAEHLLAERPDKWTFSAIATAEGSLAGFRIASRRGDAAVYSHRAAVAPERRRQGVWTALLGHTIGQAQAGGYAYLAASINARNARALSVYRRHGWRVADDAWACRTLAWRTNRGTYVDGQGRVYILHVLSLRSAM